MHGVKNEMDNKIRLILSNGFAVGTLQVFILEGSKSAARVLKEFSNFFHLQNT